LAVHEVCLHTLTFYQKEEEGEFTSLLVSASKNVKDEDEEHNIQKGYRTFFRLTEGLFLFAIT
jgi:hypothetical protein